MLLLQEDAPNTLNGVVRNLRLVAAPGTARPAATGNRY